MRKYINSPDYFLFIRLNNHIDITNAYFYIIVEEFPLQKRSGLKNTVLTSLLMWWDRPR
jgi:hypothetical protein